MEQTVANWVSATVASSSAHRSELLHVARKHYIHSVTSTSVGPLVRRAAHLQEMAKLQHTPPTVFE